MQRTSFVDDKFVQVGFAGLADFGVSVPRLLLFS